MNLAVQLMMGISLAACAGLRAGLPMLTVGLLARGGYAQLHPSFAFLARDDALVIFGAATALELLGDKIIAIDHFLDAVGTIVSPPIGTVLASSMLVGLDPLAATVLGLIVGGSTSFTVHAGKAVVRAKCSALAPFHGGIANVALSTVEDVAPAWRSSVEHHARATACFSAGAEGSCRSRLVNGQVHQDQQETIHISERSAQS